MNIYRIAAAAALVLCIGMPASVQARQVVVAPGTYIYSVSNSSVSSKDAYAGQTFSFRIVAPYPNGSSAFQNARLHARVTQVRKAGQGTKPLLSFLVDRITLANGATAPIHANLVSVAESKGSNIGTVAVSALVGMVAGNILGKWLGTNAGGAVGLTAGVLYGLNSKTNVTIPQNAETKFQVKQQLALAY